MTDSQQTAAAPAGRDFILSDSPEGADAWERTPWSGEEYGPVTDWNSDFDHARPEYNPMAHEVWRDLREDGCPVARSNRYGGMWVPITHETVSAIAYDTENFTSRAVVVSHTRPGDLALPAPVGVAPPITSDPPFHGPVRRLLLGAFSPKRIADIEPEIRALCRIRLDNLGEITPGETVIDGAVQYAQHIPPAVIGRMLGLPPEDDDYLREVVHQLLETINADPRERSKDELGLDQYLDKHINEHLEKPRDDLMSYLLNCELEGNRLDPDMVRGAIILLMVAGIDTTWSAISSSLWHLVLQP